MWLLLQTHSSGVVSPSMWLLLQTHSSGVVGPSMWLLLQTHSSGVVGPSMRPIVTDAKQWRGQSINAAYCYRRTAVAWSVHPCGLLLQTHSSGVVVPSMWPISIGAVVKQLGGQWIGFAMLF